MPIPVETITTERFAMKYFRFGTGSRKAVILPGLSFRHVSDFAEAVAGGYKVLKQQFTVYVFDRREECPEGYSIADMADDTAEAFDRLGLREACVFGASQGGMIAMQMALSRPDLIGRLALGSTASRITPDSSAVIEKWIRLAESRDLSGLAESFAESIYSRSFYERYRPYIIQMIGYPNDKELEKFLILAKASRGFDLYDKLAQIRCPVLVLAASDDRVLGQESSAEIARKCGASYILYKNYGHAVYDEAPDYKNNLLFFFTTPSQGALPPGPPQAFEKA